MLLDGQSSVLLIPIADDLLGAALVGRRVAVLGFGPSTWIVALAVGATRVEDWQAPALLNGWIAFDAAHNDAGYWKDPHGVVHLRGMMKNGAIGAAIFIMPAGYRPPRRELFATISNGALGFLYVDPTGVVVPFTGSNVYFAIDGVTFRAG